MDRYVYFIDDIKLYLKRLIKVYDFTVRHDLESDSTQVIILENNYCKIYFSTLVSFPYQSVSFEFFNENSKMEQVKFLKFWKLTVAQLDQIHIEIDNNTEYPTDSEFKGYQKDLIVINELLIRYYMPCIIMETSY